MKWKTTPITKIYEAIGAVADNRVEILGNTAKVYSSSRKKFYDVTYDPEKNAIMANDNVSFWKGCLGYPGVAFLMKKGIVSYDPAIGNLLKDTAWKDINQKFKNNFEKALDFILSSKTEDERKSLSKLAEKNYKEVKKMNLSLLGKKVKPPDGY